MYDNTGRNQNGQLGLGHTNDALSPQLVQALSGQEVTSVAGGAEHTIATTSKGEVSCVALMRDARAGFVWAEDSVCVGGAEHTSATTSKGEVGCAALIGDAHENDELSDEMNDEHTIASTSKGEGGCTALMRNTLVFVTGQV